MDDEAKLSMPRTTLGTARALAEAHQPVLLVEDDDPLRTAILRALADAGVGCCAVASAEAALEEWRMRSFQLVVTDLKLPNRSGIVLLEEFERSEVVPVVVITGYRAQFCEHLPSLHGLAILEKPFAVAELVDVVRGRLGSTEVSTSIIPVEG
jgi:two-component system response regulator QseB